MNQALMLRALELLRVKPREFNPTIDRSAVMARIAVKVERGALRMGYTPATGTQAVLRCNGRVQYKAPVKEWVN